MADQSNYVMSGTWQDISGRIIVSEYARVTGKVIYSSYAGMAWYNREGVRGIALFDTFTGSNINIHIWGVKGITRKQISDVYNYAFNQLKCNRMTGIFPKSNKNLLQLIERFGFVYECTMSDYFGTPEAAEDALVYYISREKALSWIR